MPIATFHILPSPSRFEEQKTKRAMNLSVNGQSQVPPGFRFHPTEEELLQYYLKKKVANLQIDLDVIQDIDLNKLEPWDIQEKCRIGSGPQTDWYVFSHKDKKYPTGTRTNRATAAGFWKATGRDKVICSSSSRIGMRKTLVFYMGRAPHGEKSDWIMHEYRLDDTTLDHNGSNLNGDQSATAEEGWVICRVFRKKNYVKALDSPTNRSSATSSMDVRTNMLNSSTHDLDHILSYMGKTTTSTSKDESKRSLPSAFAKTTNMRYLELDQMESFMHLPQLESTIDHQHDQMMINYAVAVDDHPRPAPSASTWAELDRLVAYQLNGQVAAEANSESARQLPRLKNDSTSTDNSIMMPFCYTEDTDTTTATANTALEHLLRSQSSRVYDSETAINDDQFWSFTKQSSSSTSLDPILHFSV